MKNGSVESLKLRVAMRLQGKGLEQPVHGGLGNPAGLGRLPHCPVRAGGGLARQRALQQGGDLLVVDGARTSWTQFVVQARQPMLNEPLAPLADGGIGPAQPARNAGVAFAFVGPQYQPGTCHEGMRKRA